MSSKDFSGGHGYVFKLKAAAVRALQSAHAAYLAKSGGNAVNIGVIGYTLRKVFACKYGTASVYKPVMRAEHGYVRQIGQAVGGNYKIGMFKGIQIPTQRGTGAELRKNVVINTVVTGIVCKQLDAFAACHDF